MKPHKKYPFIKHITTSSLCLQWLLCVIIENDSLNIYCCSSSHLFTYLSSGNNVFWNIPKLFTIMTIKYSMKVHYNIPSSLWPTRTRPAMEDENMRLWPYFFSKTVECYDCDATEWHTDMFPSICTTAYTTLTPDEKPGLSRKISHKLLNSSCCSVKSWMEFWNEQWGNQSYSCV